MRQFFLASLLVSVSFGRLQTRKFNECGCVDYKLLTRERIAHLDPDISREISKGNLTNPSFIYEENCSFIHIECDSEIGKTTQLLRTNWPENEIIYIVDMNQRKRTSTLYFNVHCDRKTHEWKYADDVENDLEIVTEYVICYSV
ncbi:unnamed protein product [Caenorhabditis nigoni]